MDSRYSHQRRASQRKIPLKPPTKLSPRELSRKFVKERKKEARHAPGQFHLANALFCISACPLNLLLSGNIEITSWVILSCK
jgi:hypothetical protein